MAKSGRKRLPKKIAGLKVPKALRKSGVLEALVASQTGRKILAEVLMAAATAAAAALVKERPAPGAADGKAGGRALMSEATHAAGGALASLVTEAAQSLVSGTAERDGSSKATSRSRAAKSRQAGQPSRAAEADPD